MEALIAISPFPILKLPVEVRLHIYRELLIQPSSFEPMLCSCYSERHQYWKDRGSINPAVLRTCKLAYAEAYPILYRENTFQLFCKYHGHAAYERGLRNTPFIVPHRNSAPLLHRAVTDLDVKITSSDNFYPSVFERVKYDYPNIRQLIVRTTNYRNLLDYSYLELTFKWVQLTSRSLRRYLLDLENVVLHMKTALVACNDYLDRSGSITTVRPLNPSWGFWIFIFNSLCDDLSSPGGGLGSHGDDEDVAIQTALPFKEWSQEAGMLWCIRDSGIVDYHPNFPRC